MEVNAETSQAFCELKNQVPYINSVMFVLFMFLNVSNIHNQEICNTFKK